MLDPAKEGSPSQTNIHKHHKEESAMKKKGTEQIEKETKEALAKEKIERKPDELDDADLENLAGGEGMTTGNIINP